jgi:HPt (histidine-containing phosphotransfer) domain-containing protein
LERICGPNAKPIDHLVEKGTSTALRVNAEYRGFARDRVNEISKMMSGLTRESALGSWQVLLAAIQDLRSSSATCGNEAISWFARSWERALDWQYRDEKRLVAAMHLHMDALRLAIAENADPKQLRVLADQLELVVQSLNPTHELGNL